MASESLRQWLQRIQVPAHRVQKFGDRLYLRTPRDARRHNSRGRGISTGRDRPGPPHPTRLRERHIGLPPLMEEILCRACGGPWGDLSKIDSEKPEMMPGHAQTFN